MANGSLLGNVGVTAKTNLIAWRSLGRSTDQTRSETFTPPTSTSIRSTMGSRNPVVSVALLKQIRAKGGSLYVSHVRLELAAARKETTSAQSVLLYASHFRMLKLSRGRKGQNCNSDLYMNAESEKHTFIIVCLIPVYWTRAS